jgi:uncharacterized protein (TIGR00369 family)
MDAIVTSRIRTYTWDDPLAVAHSSRGLAGIDFLKRIIAREIPPPPIAKTLDYDLTEVGEGRAVFTIEPGEIHYNPIGMVHGGIPCTLLDSAMGCAVHTTLPAGVGYTTLELKVNIIKAIGKNTGPLRAEARVIHAGRSTAVAEGRLVDKAGTLYAHATTTCMILRP